MLRNDWDVKAEFSTVDKLKYDCLHFNSKLLPKLVCFALAYTSCRSEEHESKYLLPVLSAVQEKLHAALARSKTKATLQVRSRLFSGFEFRF